MGIRDVNKGSFFCLEISLPNLYGLESDNKVLLNNIETNIDISLASIGAKSDVYKFQSNNKFIYLFSTYQRKRRGQLNKLIEKNLLKNSLIENYETTLCLKSEYKEIINELKNRKNTELIDEPNQFEGYSGKDLKVFNSKENWFPWQLEIHNILFHKSGEIKKTHPRHIILIYCEEGNSGKSSFFKNLFYHHPDDIGRLTSGNAHQLKSAAVKLGPKKIYIVDLPRSRSKQDSEEELLNALEDIKSGFVTSHMFGSKEFLIMEPPHVIVASNFIFKCKKLSSDRWKLYSIVDPKKPWVDITEETKELAKSNSK